MDEGGGYFTRFCYSWDFFVHRMRGLVKVMQKLGFAKKSCELIDIIRDATQEVMTNYEHYYG